MVNTACTVKAISLTTVTNGSKYVGGIDMEGNELGNIQLVADSKLSDQRVYTCTNCKKVWDGSETFDEVKKHLGTFPVD